MVIPLASQPKTSPTLIFMQDPKEVLAETEGFGHLASLRSAPRPRPGWQARPFESRSRPAQAGRSRSANEKARSRGLVFSLAAQKGLFNQLAQFSAPPVLDRVGDSNPDGLPLHLRRVARRATVLE